MAFVQHCRLLDQGSIHSYAYLLFAVWGGDRGRRIHITYIRCPEDASTRPSLSQHHGFSA